MTTQIALTGLARDLAARAETGRPIRVGVIGSGEMGTDLVTQMSLMTGIEMAAIATRRPHTALEAMTIAYGEDSKGKVADSPAQATAAIEAGKIAITSAETLVTTGGTAMLTAICTSPEAMAAIIAVPVSKLRQLTLTPSA